MMISTFKRKMGRKKLETVHIDNTLENFSVVRRNKMGNKAEEIESLSRRRYTSMIICDWKDTEK